MRRDLLLILGFGLLVFCPFLGTRDLWTSGEARVAQAAREMRESGDWIVPRIGGELRLEKPPLAYWLVAAASLPFDDVTAFNSRLPSLLAALGVLVLTYLFGRKLWSPRVGVWAALMLATTMGFWSEARNTGIEMHLLFLNILTLYAWFRYAQPKVNDNIEPTEELPASGGWLILAYVTLAFSFLDKGPVGPLLIFGIIIAYRTAAGTLLKRPRFAWHLLGMVLFAVIALPWYVAVMQRVPEAMDIWLHQSADRYEGFAHPHSPVYFLGVLAGGAQPWLIFAVMAFFLRPKETADRASWLFPVAWAGLTLLFFSVPTDKKSYYILPMYPALALCASWTLEQWRSGELSSRAANVLRGYHLVAAALLVVLGIAAIPAYLHFVQPGGKHADFAGCGLQVFALALIAGGMGYFLWMSARHDFPRRVAITVVTSVIFFAGVYIAMLPATNRHKGTHQLCERLFKRVDIAPNTRAYAYDYRGIPLLIFYMHRGVGEFNSREALRDFLFASASGNSVLAISEDDYEELPKDLKAGLRRIVEANPNDKDRFAWFMPSERSSARGFIDNSNWLTVGEQLHYVIMWREMLAGDITFTVIDTVPVEGRTAYHIRMCGDSTGLLEAVYAVHDRVDSFIDAETGHSLRFDRHIREGTWNVYKTDDRVDFDCERNELRYQKTKFDKDGNGRTQSKAPRPLTAPVQDPLSLLYHLRRKLPDVGESRLFRVGGRKGVTPVAIRSSKLANLDIPGLGDFKAVLLDCPPPEGSEVTEKVEFSLAEGDFSFWVDQESGIPLKLEVSEIPLLGNITALLRQAKNAQLLPNTSK